MKNLHLLFILCFFTPLGLRAHDTIEKISFPPPKDMSRADIYFWKGIQNPKAVLVLSPGVNGNGEGLIRQNLWQNFAKRNKLGLIGLSFASDPDLLTNGKGYYYTSQGSGKVLLDGIQKVFKNNLPLLLYGFSGGAHFTSRFTESNPQRVLAWCAYSAAWWDDPQKANVTPPGIVVCGDQDERYGASLIYFKQGRAAGKPWLWISVANNGHSPVEGVESFVRDYFDALLNRPDTTLKKGAWIDIDNKTEINPNLEPPSLTAWLPDKALLSKWREIHQP